MRKESCGICLCIRVSGIFSRKMLIGIIVLTAVLVLCFVQYSDKAWSSRIRKATITFEDIFHAKQDDQDLITYLRKNIIIKPSDENYKLAKPRKKDPSQHSQAIYFDTFFKNKEYGTFIEVGAYDGETYSNTLKLERFHGWRGLLIEPNPVSFEKLLGKHRKSPAAQCCLSLSSVPETVMFRVQKAISHISNITNTDGDGPLVSVNCFPLYSLMMAVNLTTVDLLSIDLEGVEFRVLKTLPFDKINIKTILVEVKNIPEGEQLVIDLLLKNNYRIDRGFELDYFFLKNTEY